MTTTKKKQTDMEAILESRYFWMSISAAMVLALAIWSMPEPTEGAKKKGDDKVCQ